MISSDQIQKQYDNYINTVLKNPEVYGKYEKLKVQRHLDDLERTDIFFDEAAGDRVVKFASEMRLSDDAHWKQKIHLFDHQIFFFRTLFGWKKIDPDTQQPKRRFRKSLNTKSRKNAKTQENSILTTYMFAGSGERGVNCLTAANTRDQALITYDETRNMLEHLRNDSKKAKELIRLMANACLIPSKKNVLKAMASDPRKLDGYKPTFVSIDEVHEMKTNKIIKIFELAVAQKLEPLIAISSTVGYNTTYPFYSYYRMCERVLEGVLEDDSLFIDMFALDEEDDWNDPKNWRKPNPMLGKIINRDNFEQSYKTAKNEGGTSEIDFQVKNLNKWCGSAKTWLKQDLINACRFNFEILPEEVCHVGVDLATVDDIAAVALLFPPTETHPKFRFHIEYFIPEETIDKRTDGDGVPYRQWANEGKFHVIPNSNVIDQKYIEQYVVKEVCEKYQAETIDIDRWNAVQFAGNLSREGLEVGFYGQGFKGMNEPTKLLEKLVKSTRIDVGSDKIFEWMMGNVVLATDPAGSIKPDKDKSVDKIDGVSALLTAFGGYIRSAAGKEESIYESGGIRRIGS